MYPKHLGNGDLNLSFKTLKAKVKTLGFVSHAHAQFACPAYGCMQQMFTAAKTMQMSDYPISIYQGFAIFRIADYKCQSWVFLWNSPTKNVFYRFVGGVLR